MEWLRKKNKNTWIKEKVISEMVDVLCEKLTENGKIEEYSELSSKLKNMLF